MGSKHRARFKDLIHAAKLLSKNVKTIDILTYSCQHAILARLVTASLPIPWGRSSALLPKFVLIWSLMKASIFPMFFGHLYMHRMEYVEPVSAHRLEGGRWGVRRGKWISYSAWIASWKSKSRCHRILHFSPPQRAQQLSNTLKKIAASEKFTNFDLLYMDFAFKESKSLVLGIGRARYRCHLAEHMEPCNRQ